eukprot:934586-Amphidinium_carterae.1
MKGRGRTIGVPRPPPGLIMTNLYHAHITNFHALAPPMTTILTTDDIWQQEQTQGLLHDIHHNCPKAELLRVWLLAIRTMTMKTLSTLTTESNGHNEPLQEH